MWPFKRRNITPHSKAFKDGRLVNMQLPPFRQFNNIVTHDCALVMTKAAYQALVQLPGETRRNAKVPANFRWGVLYLRFVEEFTGRTDGSSEGVFDVTVTLPGGFQVAKSVKVAAVHDFDGKEGFIFMMPHETWSQ